MSNSRNRASTLRRFPSPLRYPGGKGKIANYMKLVMLENGLEGSDYAEPFAGGASVALSLLFEELADHAYINDIDAGIHAFWSAVLYETDKFCTMIDEAELTIDEWHRQKSAYGDESLDLLSRGYATFFLNRTNRSGIIEGGVIGGQGQVGEWKLDARFNRQALIDRIEKIARFKSRITLSCDDGNTFIGDLGASIKPFFYIDPPYFVKGGGLYTNFYDPSDHAQLAATVARLECTWLVSYDAVDEILALYPDANHLIYSLSYSASAKRARGSEVMFFSSDICPPEVPSPANISVSHVDRRRIELLSR